MGPGSVIAAKLALQISLPLKPIAPIEVFCPYSNQCISAARVAA